MINMAEDSTMRPPHLWIKEIQEDEKVSGCYLVKEKRVLKTRNNKPFLNLTLADKTGDIPAKVWDRAEALSSLFQKGDIVQVVGHAGSYRDQIQLTVSELDPLKEKPAPEIFLESTTKDPSEMMRSLRQILKGVQDVN